MTKIRPFLSYGPVARVCVAQKGGVPSPSVRKFGKIMIETDAHFPLNFISFEKMIHENRTNLAPQVPLLGIHYISSMTLEGP